MREIKFRAWVNDGYMAIQGTPDLETFQSFMFHYSDQKILMQFTGQKDKNGKEIYEGDILENQQGKLDLVVFMENGFYGKAKHSSDKNRIINNPLCSDYLTNKEVIGNIFENPELITHN